MQVLRVFAFFAAISFASLQPAAAEPCTFNKAVYESVVNDDLLLWADQLLPWPEALFTKGGVREMRSYRFDSVRGTGPAYVRRSHDEFVEYAVPYYFFDKDMNRVDFSEKINQIYYGNPDPEAPAFFFMPEMADLPSAPFRIRSCKTEGASIPVMRPGDLAPPASCAFENAVYENLEDRSILATMEQERDAPIFGMKLVVQGDKTPKRSYLFNMQNGTGKLSIGDEVESSDAGASLFVLDANLKPTGIRLVMDDDAKAPVFLFMPGLPDVPDAMFRLKECKPETPTPKPVP